MKFKRIATIETQIAEILLLPATGSTRPLVDDVVLITKEIDNTILSKWQGTVKQIQDIPMPNNVIKIIAYDKKYKLNFLNVLNAGYASSKGSTIFNSEIEVSKTGLTLGTVDTSDSVLDTISFGKSVSGTDSKVTKGSAFEIIQITGNRDVYVERDGTANYNDAGTDRSSTHILEHGLNGMLLPDIGYSEDETRRVKQVIVKGAGTGQNFILGTFGTPLSTDNVRQIDLPFIPSNATATLAAETIYNELNKVNKYTKFMLVPDVFTTNYDVFDTVKVKARLTNKTINENLKIFSIETTVSTDNEISETVVIELQNFERAQLAQLSNPLEVTQKSMATMVSGVTFTQSNNNVLPASLGERSNTNINETALAGLTDVATLGTFSSQKTNGAYVHLGLEIIMRKAAGNIRFFIRDDLGNAYPASNNLDYPLHGYIGDSTFLDFNTFIPADVAGRTFTLRTLVGVGQEVEVVGQAYMFSVGL